MINRIFLIIIRFGLKISERPNKDTQPNLNVQQPNNHVITYYKTIKQKNKETSVNLKFKDVLNFQ